MVPAVVDSKFSTLFIIEFKAGRRDFFYTTEPAQDIRVGDIVIVEADRGRDLGRVVNDTVTVFEVNRFNLEQHNSGSENQITPKRLFGKARTEEIQSMSSKTEDEIEVVQLCQAKVRAKKLPMEIVDAEYQWDRRKLTIYFVAEKRVDCIDLVRELFRLYKTIIWMASLKTSAIVETLNTTPTSGHLNRPGNQLFNPAEKDIKHQISDIVSSDSEEVRVDDLCHNTEVQKSVTPPVTYIQDDIEHQSPSPLHRGSKEPATDPSHILNTNMLDLHRPTKDLPPTPVQQSLPHISLEASASLVPDDSSNKSVLDLDSGPSSNEGSHPSNQNHRDTDKNSKLIDKIQALLTDKQEYKKLLACKSSNAQRLLDVFQRLLDTTTDLSPKLRRSLVVATQRLAAASGLYPMSYELTDVTTSDMSEYSGGFSDIYKGDFRGCAVSLKTIRLHRNTQMAHFVKVVSKEAILWGQLHHPNVLPFYGIYRFKSWISLVAPWMNNGDISEYLKRHRNSSRVVLAHDVAQGLNFLHKNKIIHGDLKGTNVLINDQGRACLADFGVSSISDKDILAWTSHSSAASKGGTVRWQAPELFDPQGDVEERNTEASDIYAWACVAYEIFAGEIPLAHLNRDATIIKQVTEGERPARPPMSSPSWIMWGLTNSIWALMQLCWSVYPAERPTAQTIIDWLAPVLPPNSQAESSTSCLSSRVFREMARGNSDDDLISIETLESLLVE